MKNSKNTKDKLPKFINLWKYRQLFFTVLSKIYIMSILCKNSHKQSGTTKKIDKISPIKFINNKVIKR